MRNWLWVLIGCVGGLVHGQSVPANTDPFSGTFPRFRTMSVSDGLSQSSVVDAVQDHTGYWWLATQDGLNRYDGRHITYYEKYFDDVTRPGYSRLGRLFVDRSGDLWLIPATGLPERRTARTGRFTVFPYLKQASCLTQDAQGRYWAGTYAGEVVQFHPNRGIAARYPIPGSVYAVLQTRAGQLWLAASSGLYHFEVQTNRWVRVPVAGPNPSFSCLAEQADGTLWAGTHSQGLYRKYPAGSGFHLFTGFDGQPRLAPNLYVLALLTDRRQRVWVGTYGQGLYQLDLRTQTVNQFRSSRTNPNALAYDDILAVFEDRTGVIGVSTDGGGISFYDPSLIKFGGFTTNQVPPGIEVEQIRAICTDQQGTVWLGTSGRGLTRYDRDGRWMTYHTGTRPKNGNGALPNDRVMSLLPNPDGTLWIGTQGSGLARFDPVRQQFTAHTPKNGFPDQTIWCLFRDSQGRNWAGTQNQGLLRFSDQGQVLERFGADVLGSPNIKAIAEGEGGRLWIGTEKTGLAEFDPKTGHCQPFGLGSIPANHAIKCLYVDPKIHWLWVGTQGGGLLQCDKRTGRYRQFTTRDGLPNNVIYGILANQQHLWLSTNKGLCQFRVGNWGAQPIVDRFTPDDGLQSMEFNTGASYRGPDGTLYFGGVAGFNGFRPSTAAGRSMPSQVAITAIDINGQSLTADTLPEVRRRLSLRHDQNTVAFTVAALHFSLPMRNRFRYKLDGYDAAWTDADTRNYIRYTNLPAARYTLRVRAAGYDGGWSTDEARLLIEISPPLWARWWFVLAVIAVVAGGLYGFYQYRISQLLRIQSIRNRLSADLHDEIGSSLSSIGILGTLASGALDGQHPAHSFVSRITEETRLISRSMADIVWSINPRNDELDSLLSRMNRFAAELLEAKQIAYQIDLPPPDGTRQLMLPMEQRRDMYLLFKEAVNNLIKYAQCTQVQISLKLVSNTFCLTIQDNGIGFDPQIKSSGNGLYTMQQRAKNLHGKLHIDSVPGLGTTIRLTFPFNQMTHMGH